MTLQQANNHLRDKLYKTYEKGEADTIAKLYLQHITNLSNNDWIIERNKELPREIIEIYTNGFEALIKGKPLQYVLEEAWFFGRKFYVNEHVLIPRPETEELIAWIREDFAEKDTIIDIIDIGTGSGCIPITLKLLYPNSTIETVDVSEAAIQIAVENAEALEALITIKKLDFLNTHETASLSLYNIIISNPPYIPIKEKEALANTVTSWEPHLALFVANNDPLLFYRNIALFGKEHLLVNGVVYVECHQDYAKAVALLFEEFGYITKLKKDINGNERIVKAWLN